MARIRTPCGAEPFTRLFGSGCLAWILAGLTLPALRPASGLHPDELIARLAGRQHGVVARWQLLGLGISVRAIGRRIESGHLRRVHRGVYAVGHSLLSVHGEWLAAVLACGPDALLSHWSAAALWGFGKRRRGIHVLAPSPLARPGISSHRARNLSSADRSKRAGVPLTSPARTLLDLAGASSPEALQRAFEEADRLGLLREKALRDVLRRNVGHRGCGRLRVAIDHAYAPAPTRSELEHRFRRLCLSIGGPQPEFNVLVEGFTVDAFWPQERLVVELIGKEYHYTRAAVERDRTRVARLRLAGYEVLEFTWRQVVDEPGFVAALLQRTLAERA